MHRLLRADLQALGNLRRSEKGVRILRASVVSLVWMALVSMLWGAGARLALSYPQAETPPRIDLLAGLLAPSMVLAIATSLGFGRRQLLEHPSLELTLSAPIPPARVLFAAWLRISAVAWLFGVTLSGPSLWMMTETTEVGGWLRVAGIVIAVGGVALPAVGLLAVLQVLLARFAGGRANKLVSAALHLAVSLLFLGLVVFGLVAGDRFGAEGVAALGRQRYGLRALLAAPASVLEGLVDGDFAAAGMALTRGVVTIAACGAIIWLVGATCYRGAFAMAKVEGTRSRRGRRSHWPSSAIAVAWRKDMRQLIAQPRQLMSFVIGPLLVSTIAWSGDLSLGGPGFGEGSVDGAMPAGIQVPFSEVFSVLALWWIAALTVLPVPLMRIVQADARQWVTFVASPISAGRLLLAKAAFPSLVVVVWPIVIAAGVGNAFGVAGWFGMVCAAALLVPSGLWLACWMAALATWPWLVRPDEDAGGSPRGTLGVFIGMLLLNLAAVPALFGWIVLSMRANGDGPLAGIDDVTVLGIAGAVAWSFALAFGLPALLIARRNMRQLLAPER